ncbi:MAG: hypothetical protein WCK17_16260, partial [Verrucomicrobiota bacterium]
DLGREAVSEKWARPAVRLPQLDLDASDDGSFGALAGYQFGRKTVKMKPPRKSRASTITSGRAKTEPLHLVPSHPLEVHAPRPATAQTRGPFAGPPGHIPFRPMHPEETDEPRPGGRSGFWGLTLFGEAARLRTSDAPPPV